MLTNADALPVGRAVRLFGLLGDETRLRLLLTLAEGGEGVPVGGLAQALGLSRTALNHQLQLLRLAGVVTHRSEGQNVFYALAQGPAQSVLMSVWRTCWQQGRSALDFLSQLLRGMPVALAMPP